MSLYIGKYETLGSLTVAAFLLTGGIGIGLHSFELLMAIISGSTGMVEATAAAAADTAATTSSAAKIGHGHHHGDILDPNAAWFAGISVIAKEWLYRASMFLFSFLIGIYSICVCVCVYMDIMISLLDIVTAITDTIISN